MPFSASDTQRTDRIPRPLLQLALVVLLGAVMMQLDATMTNIATNTLLRQFDTTLNTIQWVGTGYLLATAMVIPLSGWAMERFGARTVWMTSLILFVAGSLLCGLAWSPGSLIAFRIVQGLGGGMVLPLMMAILGQAAGPLMGRLMAVIGIPTMLGPVLGPVLGGMIVDNLSWRWIFYINLPICLIALVFAWRVIPVERASGAGGRLDLLGLLLLSPALAALVYALAEAGQRGGVGHWQVLIPLVAGVAMLLGFALHALRNSLPLIDIRLFATRAFGSAAAAIFACGIVLFGAMALLPLYYQQVHGDSAARAGLAMAPMGIGMAISFVLIGKVSSRVSPRTIALVGIICAAVGSAFFTRLGSDPSAYLLAAAQVVSGFGLGGTLMPIMTAALGAIDRAAIPRASTAIRIVQQLGFSVGSAVMFIVLQHEIGNATAHPGHAIPHELATAYGQTFWWVLGFAVLAIVPTLFLPGRAATAAESEVATESVLG
ncbi:MDR family MFS transporter [Nocardia sp. NPDC088792]|uniref:MDR family MFS transporter n=1 Tax=Nocardia sp. NPDC088792 TaxID=3364332 RepID=UPI00381F188C